MKSKIVGKRTHEEKIEACLEAFGELKMKALRSGNVNDCSVNKVSEKAGVGIDYLKGKVKLKKDAWAVEKYVEIKNKILEFKKNYSVSLEGNEEQKLIKELQSEILTLKDSFHETFTSSFTDKELIVRLKEQNKELQDNFTLLQANKFVKQRGDTRCDGKVVSLERRQFETNFKKIIISPDTLLNENEFREQYEDRRSAAWYKVYDELEKSLNGEHAKMFYMTVGLPNSGKSTWSSAFLSSLEHDVVILDATNLTISDRYDIWFRLKNSKNTIFSVVYFYISIETIMDRNIMREPEKRLSNDDLYRMSIQLQQPDYIKEKWIEQLFIVRE